MFGEWVDRLGELHDEYDGGCPFRHVVIEDFFDTMSPVPDPDSSWIHYDNPIEQKYILDTCGHLPMIMAMQSNEFVHKIETITGIRNLRTDPDLRAAGVHAHTRGGKLDIHLDYSFHQKLGMERRCNLIVYMSDWNEDWGGDLQLWNADMSAYKSISPKLNTAVLFECTDTSFHGVPTPIMCPEGVYRKSLAVYYLSEPRPDMIKRYRAEFFPYSGKVIDDRMRRLYDIRKTRNLIKDDLV